MGDKCKIFEKDGRLFTTHYFTNSAENTFVVSVDNSWWTHLQKLRDVDILLKGKVERKKALDSMALVAKLRTEHGMFFSKILQLSPILDNVTQPLNKLIQTEVTDIILASFNAPKTVK